MWLLWGELDTRVVHVSGTRTVLATTWDITLSGGQLRRFQRRISHTHLHTLSTHGNFPDEKVTDLSSAFPVTIVISLPEEDFSWRSLHSVVVFLLAQTSLESLSFLSSAVIDILIQ